MNKKTGKKVRTETQQIPIGQSVYRDPTTGRVCLKPNTKGSKDCPVALDPSQNRALSASERLGYHGAIGLGNRIDQYQGAATKGAELLTDPAKLSTTAREAEERAERAAKSAVSTLKDQSRAKEAARQAWNGTVDATQGAWQAAKNWWNKPAEKKLDDLAQAGGGMLLDAPVNMATGAVVGGVLRTGETALEVGEDMRKAAQAGKRIEGAVDQAKDEVQHQAAKGAAKGAPTEPYNRRKHYGDTPTTQDRRAVGGESVDHDPPLVQRYYEGDPARGEPPGFQLSDAERRASAKDRDRMQPSTQDAQRRQGGQMSGYSKGKKQEHGL